MGEMLVLEVAHDSETQSRFQPEGQREGVLLSLSFLHSDILWFPMKIDKGDGGSDTLLKGRTGLISYRCGVI
jgi:hypothetical protein